MPRPRRPHRQPSDAWPQLRLLATSPEQASYELVRPILLFGQPPDERAREMGVSASTLRRKAVRVATQGLLGLFAQIPSPDRDQRRLPPEIRHAIVALKAEVSAVQPAQARRDLPGLVRPPGRPPDGGRVLATGPKGCPAPARPAAVVLPLPRRLASARHRRVALAPGIVRGQAWQTYIETMFSIMGRMADYDAGPG